MAPVVQFVATELGPGLANRKLHIATFHAAAGVRVWRKHKRKRKKRANQKKEGDTGSL